MIKQRTNFSFSQLLFGKARSHRLAQTSIKKTYVVCFFVSVGETRQVYQVVDLALQSRQDYEDSNKGKELDDGRIRRRCAAVAR